MQDLRRVVHGCTSHFHQQHDNIGAATTTGWRRRWRRVLNQREQDQETASDRSRHHRFLWHSRSRRPYCGGRRAAHTAVDATRQSLGNGIVGRVLDLLNCTHHSRCVGGGATAPSGDTECHDFSLGRDGSAPCAPSSCDDHGVGSTLQSDDPTARSSGHSATAGTVADQCDPVTVTRHQEALLSAPVPAGQGSRRPTRQSVCTHVAVWLAPVSLDSTQPFVSNQPFVHT